MAAIRIQEIREWAGLDVIGITRYLRIVVG